jgi:putative ABC transport system permease protein
MFLAWRDLRVAKGRFVLVGLVISLIALLTTLLSGLATGLVDDGISGLRDLPLTHLALQPGAEHSFSRSSLDDRALDAWKDADGVQVSPLGVSFFNAKDAQGATIDMALFGVPADSFLIPRQDGRSALGTPNGVVLSDEFEEQGVRVGDTLTIVGPDQQVEVMGFTYAGSYGHVPIAFTSLETWQQLVYGDNARGRFSAIAVAPADGGSIDPAALATVDRAAGTELETKEQAFLGSPGFAAETTTMSLIRGFLLLISALIVGAFFTVWTVQRTRQIGLMKALGASNSYVLRDALGQLAVVLVASTLVGVLVAVGLGSLVGGDVPFSLQLAPVAGSAAILVVLGMAGSLVALRRVTSVDPVIALGAES